MSDFYFYYPSKALSSSLARRAFITGRWRVAIETETRVETLSPKRNLLIASADGDSSGRLNLPLVGARDVFFYASTETLPRSERFVPLFLELSRGQLSRLYGKYHDWILYGFVPPRAIRLNFKKGLSQFAKLATTDPSEPQFDERCVELFNELRKLSERFNESFFDKALESRRALTDRWSLRFGFSAALDEDWRGEYDEMFAPKRLGRRTKLERLFETHYATFSWKDIEREDGSYDWSALDAAYAKAEARGLDVAIGPIVRWGEALPARYKDASDAEVVDGYKRYVEALVARDARRARRWIVATNVERAIDGLSLETRLSLAARTAVFIGERCPNAQTFLGFEQAFGDASRFGRNLYMSPFEMAARIVRRRVFDGFYIEVNFGSSRSATPPRDPMEFHTFFDHWGALGVPLCVATSCPSAPQATFADEGETVSASDATSESSFSWFWKKRGASLLTTDADAGSEIVSFFNENMWTEKTQLETARRFISSAIARRAVDEIVWTRWRDVPAREFGANDDSSQANEFRARPALTLAPYPPPPPEVLGESTDRDDDGQEEISVACVSDDDREFDLLDEEEDDERALGRREGREVLSNRELFPTSGLFDVNGKMKPTVQKLSALKRAFLS